LPLPELKERIVVAAEMEWQDVPARNDLAKQAANDRPINAPGLHGEADDPSGELVHDDHDPMDLEKQ